MCLLGTSEGVLLLLLLLLLLCAPVVLLLAADVMHLLPQVLLLQRGAAAATCLLSLCLPQGVLPELLAVVATAVLGPAPQAACLLLDKQLHPCLCNTG
jgi:hypothetical protein